MPERLRMLGPEDAEAAARLDRLAYGRDATQEAFARELTNPVARYIGLETGGGELFGMAGSWYLLDEAHVITIAVTPDARRNGYGRVLLHALLDLAMRYGMNAATLEVRPSNTAARALYRLYGFHEVGRRTGYYPDTGEDALIMTTEELREAPYQERFRELEAALAARAPGLLPIEALPADLRADGV